MSLRIGIDTPYQRAGSAVITRALSASSPRYVDRTSCDKPRPCLTAPCHPCRTTDNNALSDLLLSAGCYPDYNWPNLRNYPVTITSSILQNPALPVLQRHSKKIYRFFYIYFTLIKAMEDYLDFPNPNWIRNVQLKRFEIQ